jgi:ribose 5-phosphate isomerase B
MKLAVGSDHAGFELRNALVAWLRTPEGGKHQVLDVGCGSADSCDYPDFAAAVARAVSAKRVSRGILICGTGIGMAMAANKVAGIRAAVVWRPDVAALAAEHNNANVLCLPARFVSNAAAQDMVKAFLTTPFGGGRHMRRVKKINQIRPCEA